VKEEAAMPDQPLDIKTDATRILPSWAPRVTQQEIRRLYQTDAMGIYDEELIDEVGYGLLARCRSFVDAVSALCGRARCPSCAAFVTHDGKQATVLRCECGWELTWGEYLETIRRKQLSGAEPVLDQFGAFIAAFPEARTPQEKTILIDQLLHGFHLYYKTKQPTRPVAINLIEGRLNEVVAFLDDLTRGENSTPGVATNYARWDANIQEHADWYASRSKGADEPVDTAGA
jgi:hypothetical protein